MRILGVIPARWASTRFPGKALADIAGTPMIVRVWERASRAAGIDTMIVASDDERIATVCKQHGIDVAMTSSSHESGTDRVAEVARENPADIYVNVQGDEPLIDPVSIERVCACLKDNMGRGIGVATGYLEGASEKDAGNPSVVHLVPTLDGCVLTFSRAPAPYAFRDTPARTTHVGLYAFTGEALEKFASRQRGPVERAEGIELMRFLEYGDRIAAVLLPEGSIGVDHPEDVARVEAVLAKRA